MSEVDGRGHIESVHLESKEAVVELMRLSEKMERTQLDELPKFVPKLEI